MCSIATDKDTIAARVKKRHRESQRVKILKCWLCSDAIDVVLLNEDRLVTCLYCKNKYDGTNWKRIIELARLWEGNDADKRQLWNELQEILGRRKAAKQEMYIWCIGSYRFV